MRYISQMYIVTFHRSNGGLFDLNKGIWNEVSVFLVYNALFIVEMTIWEFCRYGIEIILFGNNSLFFYFTYIAFVFSEMKLELLQCLLCSLTI